MGHIFLGCLRWLRNLIEIDARYLARWYSFPPRLTIFSRRGSCDDRLSGTKMRAGNRAVTALTGRRKTYCNDLRVGSGTSTSRGTCVLAWASRVSSTYRTKRIFVMANRKRGHVPRSRPFRDRDREIEREIEKERDRIIDRERKEGKQRKRNSLRMPRPARQLFAIY